MNSLRVSSRPALSLAAIITAASLLVSVILLAPIWAPLRHNDFVANGDVAADELLLDQGRHHPLLYGHYSRFNFNHPGPFFFDVRLMTEPLLRHFFPGPVNYHTVALVILNAIFIGLAAAAAYALAGGGPTGWLAALGSVTVVLFQFHDSKAILTSIWMPNVLRMPYLAFLLALLLMARGSLFGFIAATFCGAALVHGYVAMPAFVAPPWLLALSIGMFLRRRQNLPFPKGVMAVLAIIILSFAAPMAIDALLHPPGNIRLILDYIQETSANNPQPNSDDLVINGVVGHWKTLHTLLWLPLILALLLELRHPRQLLDWGLPVVFISLSVLLFGLYLRTAPPPLYDYIGYFHDEVPLALAVWGVIRLIRGTAGRWPIAACMIAVCVASLALGGGQEVYQGIPQIRPITQAIIARHPDHGVVLRMADGGQWNLMISLMADLDRSGIESCTPYLFPGMPEESITHRLCATGRAGAQRYLITSPGACAANCLADNIVGSIGIDQEPLPEIENLQHVLFSQPVSRQLLGSGWSVLEPWGVWSDGRRAEIRLDPDALGDASIVKFDVAAFLDGAEKELDVPVSVNGIEVAHWHFNESDNRGVRTVSISASARRHRPLVIAFTGIGAQSPAMIGMSADARLLGLALYSLEVAR